MAKNIKITEDYVSYETALLAQKKGFDNITCITYYRKELNNTRSISQRNGQVLLAPTLNVLRKWLKQIHNIDVIVNFETIDDSETAYTYTIIEYVEEGIGQAKNTWDFYKKTTSFVLNSGWWNSHEEALDNGLKEVLKKI